MDRRYTVALVLVTLVAGCAPLTSSPPYGVQDPWDHPAMSRGPFGYGDPFYDPFGYRDPFYDPYDDPYYDPYGDPRYGGYGGWSDRRVDRDRREHIRRERAEERLRRARVREERAEKRALERIEKTRRPVTPEIREKLRPPEPPPAASSGRLFDRHALPPQGR